MKIDQDHLYYGAAVIQIAEHPSFTAINDFKKGNKPVRCAYWVNQSIGVYLKYRSKPDRTALWGDKKSNEYLFGFNEEALKHLKSMRQKTERVFLGLVCVKDSNICCLSYADFEELLARRRKHKGSPENQYTLTVALPPGGKFRAFVTPAGRRNRILGDPILVARKDFPGLLFQ